MNNIRYVLYPGYVTSRTDGERHFISAGTLIKLYKVPAKDCISIEKCAGISRKNIIELHPRYDGNYTLSQ